MFNRYLFLLRGESGSGKGTRVSTLLEFLKTKYKHKSIFIEEINNIVIKKPYQLAIIFPEIKLCIIGRWVKSHKSGLISFSSLDTFGQDHNYLYNGVFKYFKDYHLMMEGFRGKGWEYDPITIKQKNINTYFCNHFLYDTPEQITQRCYERSGKLIETSCWSKNNSDSKNKDKKLLKYNKENDNIFKVIYQFYNYNEPVFKFGKRFLLEFDIFNNDYIDFVLKNNTLRHVENKENNSKYLKYLQGDSLYIENIKL
jgi:hypothetical protein